MTEIFSSVDDLVSLLEMPKSLVMPLAWIEPQNGGQRGLRLRASVSDGVATLKGVGVQISCSLESFDLPFHVVLLADYRGKPRAMARIDINGPSHPNALAVCADLQFRDAGPTHFHDTRLHRGLTIDQLFGNWDLPVARPIQDMPRDFSTAMAKCGELLHITNMGEIEEPRWQPRRFPL